jgi:hypothetical protein
MARLVKRPAAIWAGVVWIGGLGVLIGSVIFSTFGVATGAPAGSTTTANQGLPGQSAWPVSASQSGIWNVGVDSLPSLPSGSNDIGTVHVANPGRLNGLVDCGVIDGHGGCQVGQGGVTTNVINTVSVFCTVAPGHKVQLDYLLPRGLVGDFSIPLTFIRTDSVFDYDGATLTDLGMPGGGTFGVVEDYQALSGDGANCSFTWVGTAS